MSREIRWKYNDGIAERLKNLVLPGFDKVPIYDVILFFIRGFRKGALVTRASSIAFNLLLALLPATFFLFSLIPYIPVPDFQKELIEMFKSILPENAYIFIETSIVDIIANRSNVFLIVMLLVSAIMSTNGIHALIHAFVVSDHKFATRSWIAQRRVSFLLLLIVIFMIATAAALLIFGQAFVQRLVDQQILKTNWVYYILLTLKWITIVLLLFIAISFLYYLAPARKAKFRFISAGSTLATILFIVTSLGFSAYVNNFGQYNKLYGSMGTILVILLWLYLNSITLLIGFELNASIRTAHTRNNSNNNDHMQ